MKIKSILKDIITRINKTRRNIIIKNYRKRNKNEDFSLISQNCIGGTIYSDLGLSFNSPTINMFIEDESFVKLVENLEYYMKIKPIPKEECYIDPIDESIRYPKIAIDDIEICCLHYSNCAEAIEAWERRKIRINYDKVYVIANSWNLHERKDLIDRICKTPYKKVIFTAKEYDNIDCIYLKGESWKIDKRGMLRPALTQKVPYKPYRYYETIWDFIEWLNQ